RNLINDDNLVGIPSRESASGNEWNAHRFKIICTGDPVIDLGPLSGRHGLALDCEKVRYVVRTSNRTERKPIDRAYGSHAWNALEFIFDGVIQVQPHLIVRVFPRWDECVRNDQVSRAISGIHVDQSHEASN